MALPLVHADGDALSSDVQQEYSHRVKAHSGEALPRSDHSAPALLTFARYYGTLAAIRSLGRRGVPVVVADSDRFAFGKWSRYAVRREVSPPLLPTDRYLEWLLTFGRQNPGHVLYPTSDDMAWLIAEHHVALSQYFTLYTPPLPVIRTLLDKPDLYAACRHVGLDVVQTQYPKSVGELEAIARSTAYPVLIKLATQAFLPSNDKGVVVETHSELIARVRQFVERSWYADSFVSESPDIVWPMIQTYYPESATDVYGLSGFIDQTGQLYDMRATRKVLQYPRKLGVGLCFEEAPIEPQLRDKLADLCRMLGYWGVFEVEFVRPRGADSYLLIDFNPRYFHQMQFDVVRGMELPAMVYYAATGNTDRLQDEIEKSKSAGEYFDDRRITHGLLFRLMLLAQRLSGSMTAAEVREWREWYSESGTVCDMLGGSRDPLPVAVNAAALVRHYMRYPRYFVRTFARNTT